MVCVLNSGWNPDAKVDREIDLFKKSISPMEYKHMIYDFIKKIHFSICKFDHVKLPKIITRTDHNFMSSRHTTIWQFML